MLERKKEQIKIEAAVAAIINLLCFLNIKMFSPYFPPTGLLMVFIRIAGRQRR